jgi:signal transduction histidine kinase
MDMIARQPSGFFETKTREGISVYAAFRRSEVSDWGVVIGVPTAQLDRDMYAFLGMTGTGALLLLGAGVGLAGRQSSRIASELRALAPAVSLDHGAEVAIPRSSIREIDETAVGIERALQQLQLRTIERDAVFREKEVAERTALLKDEFIATVSHELRTPLTALTASLGLLKSGVIAGQSDASSRMISIAHANSQRLARLVNDILDVGKLEAGKVVFALQRVDVGSLIELAIEAHSANAASCGVRLRFENTCRYDVNADPDRLMQVVTNLLSNAIKFSAPDSDVIVAIECRGNNVRFSVTDRGPGIPEGFRSRIFQKFAQAEASNASRAPGSGLGLSIAREIVARLRGEIGFCDADGGGTTFSVELPRLPSRDRCDGCRFALSPPAGSDIEAADAACEQLRQSGLPVACLPGRACSADSKRIA